MVFFLSLFVYNLSFFWSIGQPIFCGVAFPGYLLLNFRFILKKKKKKKSITYIYGDFHDELQNQKAFSFLNRLSYVFHQFANMLFILLVRLLLAFRLTG